MNDDSDQNDEGQEFEDQKSSIKRGPWYLELPTLASVQKIEDDGVL